MRKVLHMKTIKFIALGTLLGLFTAFAALTPARAEVKAAKVAVIISDSTVSNYKTALEEFKAGLGHPVLEFALDRGADSEKEVEKTLTKLRPEVIYCIGTRAYLLAARAAKGSKLIFSSVINYQRLPRGEKSFGVANELPPRAYLTLYRYIFPGITTIGLIYSKQYNQEWALDAIESAKEAGITLVARAINSKDELPAALNEVVSETQALWLIPDPVVISNREALVRIFNTVQQHKKPVFSYSEAYLSLGSALVISADTPTIARQAAGLAREVLSNSSAEPAVQSPAGTYIILNMKKALEYKIEVDMDAMDSVNRIVR